MEGKQQENWKQGGETKTKTSTDRNSVGAEHKHAVDGTAWKAGRA